jgi:hypothetical protein
LLERRLELAPGQDMFARVAIGPAHEHARLRDGALLDDLREKLFREVGSLHLQVGASQGKRELEVLGTLVREPTQSGGGPVRVAGPEIQPRQRTQGALVVERRGGRIAERLAGGGHVVVDFSQRAQEKKALEKSPAIAALRELRLSLAQAALGGGDSLFEGCRGIDRSGRGGQEGTQQQTGDSGSRVEQRGSSRHRGLDHNPDAGGAIARGFAKG